ncbi:MAG TPA: PepSY domain-containing protein [Kiloniellaceae bacterium]
MRTGATRTSFIALAVSLSLLPLSAARADRAPMDEERSSIETVLRAEGYTSWEEIEFDDDDDDADDQVWEVDDARGADGVEYDLKLDRDYRIIKRERD